MCNVLLFPIHIGVPPLHEGNKNQMCAKERIMKDVLEGVMGKTQPQLILKKHMSYLSKKEREAQAKTTHKTQKVQEM
jgi:flagellar motor component MotA